jgi:hypothetical protein
MVYYVSQISVLHDSLLSSRAARPVLGLVFKDGDPKKTKPFQSNRLADAIARTRKRGTRRIVTCFKTAWNNSMNSRNLN